MRLGMFMMPVHPPGRALGDTLAEDTTKSILADQLGYDELWMGEHFSATTEPFPSPLMFLAGLVPQTKNLTFGTAVINLPNHHPAIVAGEAAQFDHMSGGRFLFGIGSGGLASDFELFNDRPGDAAARLHGIDRHDPAHLGAGPALRPARANSGTCRSRRRSCPSSASASCRSRCSSRIRRSTFRSRSPDSASAKLAGSKGWGIISGPIAPLYAVAIHWQAYSEARRAAGKPARSEDWRVSRAASSSRRPTRSARPRLRRARLEPLLLHLHARPRSTPRSACS